MKDKHLASGIHPNTLAIWAGEENIFAHGSTVPPLSLGVAYGYEDIDEWQQVALGNQPGYIYGRNANPTVRVLEEKMKRLEDAEACTSFSTGMAAISNTLFSLLKPGMRVVSQRDTYGGTSNLFIHFLPERGIDVTLCNTTDFDEMEREIGKGCDLLYLESPTNPTLKILDLKRLVAVAREVNALVVVDNTLATPIYQRPLKLSADLVVHSATKFLSGHADALGGILCGRTELVQKVFHYREICGASLHPNAAYLIIRGLKTLALRMERHGENAQKIAEFLEAHPEVEAVFYPGLSGHPHHSLASGQMSGYGGVLSFVPRGDFDRVKTVLHRLRYARLAAHLGSAETMAGPPRTTSHVELSVHERESLGIPENLIRYSVGLEDVEDLIADLRQALE